jgi:hypothetical protein
VSKITTCWGINISSSFHIFMALFILTCYLGRRSTQMPTDLAKWCFLCPSETLLLSSTSFNVNTNSCSGLLALSNDQEKVTAVPESVSLWATALRQTTDMVTRTAHIMSTHKLLSPTQFDHHSIKLGCGQKQRSIFQWHLPASEISTLLKIPRTLFSSESIPFLVLVEVL